MIPRSFPSIALLATVLLSAACADVVAPSRLQPGSSSNSGGTGGGGGTTVSGVSILPTTAPAPDVLIRESFGMADGFRPAGGKGAAKSVYASTSLSGFWLEYPGSKNTQWISPDAGQ